MRSKVLFALSVCLAAAASLWAAAPSSADDKTQVLDIAAGPELTLITCFPFDYVGAAPQRFIVHAHLQPASLDAISSGR